MSLPRSLANLSFCLALALGIILYPSTASAGIGFQTPSPDELKMTSEPKAPGAAAIILYRQVDRDDSSITSHEDDYVRIKILTEEGRKYADPEIRFYKEQENISNIKARTIRPDGTIANFDGKIFDKNIVKAKGVKYLAKTFTLPDVQVGSIIEYSFTVHYAEGYAFDSHWFLSQELFTKTAKFSLKPSDAPNLTYKCTWQYLPQGTANPSLGTDGFMRLESNNIPAFQIEDYMPPEDELKSRVDFTYFTRDLASPDAATFWAKYDKKYYGKLEGFIGKSKAMEQAVSQIVSSSDSPDTKLQKIYARVQQMRNTSFEVQKTEQESKREKEKAASNVEEIWRRGYGDSNELPWLFLALARAAGFEAYGVLLSSRHQYFFQPASMDESRLNENVVLVKLNGKDVYCDPGVKFVPFGSLPWDETAVKGLLINKDGGTWIQTPLPESSQARIERTANLKLSDTGDLEGKLTVTFVGTEASLRRIEERNEDEASRNKYLEDGVKEYIPVDSKVELTNKPDWDSSAQTLVAEFNVKISGWASSAGHRMLVPAGIFAATEKHVFEHGDRIHPVYFDFPRRRLDDLTIELPQGLTVESLPQPSDEEGRVVVYTLNAENNNGTLHITRKLSIDLLLVETKNYDILQQFFQAVRTGDEQEVVLQRGAGK